MSDHGESFSFSHGANSLRGTGSVERIELPAPWATNLGEAQRQLTALAASGKGSVGFVAFPFDRSAPATIFVPAHVELSGIIAPGDDEPRDPADAGSGTHGGSEFASAGSPPPSEPTVRDLRDRSDWRAAVGAARDRIAAGDLTKVVLARDVLVEGLTRSPSEITARMASLYPSSYRFEIDGFVGASPELLVQRDGWTVRAQPMAGTLPTLTDNEANERAAAALMASSKNRTEHQITIDMVHDSLLGWCSYLDAEPEPRVIAAGPVQHLATTVEGRLSDPMPSVLELVGSLHPTPAVGGLPRTEALALIAELEPTSRDRYAGPVGWFDAEGNGTFAVGIRSAQLGADSARLFAGVGVVADSDPDAELAESEAKLEAMLNVLR